MPYPSASEVVFHEEALYQVYVHFPLPTIPMSDLQSTCAG